MEELARLFPRGLFEDALPPIALRSQVYSLVPDRTVADLQLVRSARETVGGPRPVPPSHSDPRQPLRQTSAHTASPCCFEVTIKGLGGRAESSVNSPISQAMDLENGLVDRGGER